MSSNRYTGGEIILKALADQDVEVVFGYPGGVTLPLYNDIYKQNSLRHVLVGHEQGGVHAAEGYARSTGKTGVAMATSGPGATNTVTGLVDALMDSIPLVCITGQVTSALIGNDAFQEADTTGITRPATKHNYLVKSTEDLARIIHEAFYIAANGRPGPVLIDVPKDIIMGMGEYVGPEGIEPRNYKPQINGDREAIEEAGCALGELVSICDYMVSPGCVNETVAVFCAKVDASAVANRGGNAMEHEETEVQIVDFNTCMQSLNEGKFGYALTIIALQWLALHREVLRENWR